MHCRLLSRRFACAAVDSVAPAKEAHGLEVGPQHCNLVGRQRHERHTARAARDTLELNDRAADGQTGAAAPLGQVHQLEH